MPTFFTKHATNIVFVPVYYPFIGESGNVLLGGGGQVGAEQHNMPVGEEQMIPLALILTFDLFPQLSPDGRLTGVLWCVHAVFERRRRTVLWATSHRRREEPEWNGRAQDTDEHQDVSEPPTSNPPRITWL